MELTSSAILYAFSVNIRLHTNTDPAITALRKCIILYNHEHHNSLKLWSTVHHTLHTLKSSFYLPNAPGKPTDFTTRLTPNPAKALVILVNPLIGLNHFAL